MTTPFAGDPDAGGLAADRLRDIESVTDAALSRLDEQALLNALVERVKEVLQADTAAVLLLDERAGQLVATAASGIDGPPFIRCPPLLDGQVIRVHPIRHDRTRELGAFANPKGRPRRKNSAIGNTS